MINFGKLSNDMYQGMFDGLEALFKFIAALLIIFIPLGLWKLIDIIIWVWNHIHITIK